MQKTIIIGNIGQGAQFKEGASGSFLTFTVAVNERWKKDGETKERTTWYNCVYNFKADVLAPYLTRGTQVYLEGKLNPKIYTDGRGMNQIDMQFTVREIQLVGAAKREEPALAPAPAAAPISAGVPVAAGEDSEDLPF
ncbi:single-stranded DNA-binding protein [Rudanella paleaurantiibacter]|uniref:Single-stranded DNA-binding protein n=1 Tax=Rudanella paleaurantiibacter TaxID=2614655 RepID=A0A7J5TVV7_9BACT|nr:single-stranded DNA-binding protein [Rudanella paleaurantiibacter]KAB7728435.1 single-stranded DNA-binding protein [Rudanella paleaurantiibacter]